MARLPTYLDLSGPDSLRSGRAIASYDTSAIGRGLESLGGSIAAIGREARDQENTVDIARAEAEKTKGLLDTQDQFAHDPDYSTYGKRAPAKTGEVVTNAANLIRDPQMRERWQAQAQVDAIRVNDHIANQGVQLKRDAETVAFDDALETNRRIYVDPNSTDAARKKAKADIEGAIQAGQASGLLDPNAAAQRRKTYVEDAEFSRGKLAVNQDPSVVTKPLPQKQSDRAATAMGYFQSKGYTKEQAAGIVGNLLAESSLDTGARNGGDGADGSDSIGIGQWNSDRARNLKAFAEQNHVDWRDFGVQLAFVEHELRTSEKAAGDSLRSAKDVKSAAEAMIMYERPAGSDKGPQNAIAYKKRLALAAQAAGQDVNPDWYKALSPEQRAVIDQEAQTRSNQIAVENRGNIEVATTNAPIAIQNTGTYTGNIPTAEDFFQAYGPQDGADRYNNFVASMQTSQQAYDMRTMSAADIQTMVEQARPTSSGEDAALQQKRYEVLSSAAETTLKARAADPAAYAQQAFPAVATAWSNVSTPETFQAAVSASVAAQQQLGVKDIQPLPKAVADNAVNGFKDETQPQQARIAAATNAIFSTPDAGQRRAIFNQMVKAGLPDITEGAIEAMARGDAGAAQRLFEAAMIDPTKLAGNIPGGLKPADIDQAVQDGIMDQGKIGDVYYGLSDGTAENYIRAQRDAKLINNAVNLRLRKGESLDSAVEAVAKDLYGDVRPVTADNVQILVPANQDSALVVSGLQAVVPDVRTAMTEAMTLPPVDGRDRASGTRAILDATTSAYIDNVVANGVFKNSGDGYAFLDPYTGAAIADRNGQPIIFHPDLTKKPPTGPAVDKNLSPWEKPLGAGETAPAVSGWFDPPGAKAPPPAIQSAPVEKPSPKQRPAVDVAPGFDHPLTDRDFEAFQKRMLDASASERAKALAASAAAEKAAKDAYEAQVAEHKRVRSVLAEQGIPQAPSEKPRVVIDETAGLSEAKKAAAAERAAKTDYERRVEQHKRVREILRKMSDQ